MKDEEKTKKQLFQELDQMRQRVAQLEALEIEYKQTEEALRESEESLRALLNAIRESAFLMDTEGIVLQANEAVASRFGISVEQFVGSCAYDFVPPDVCKKRKERATEVIRTNRLVRFEDMRHDRYIDNTIYPVFDKEGKVIKMAILGIDITERKQAEEALQRARKERQDIFEAVEHPIVILDPQHAVIAANRAVIKATGKSEDELKGLKCYEIFHEKGATRPPEGCPMEKMLLSGKLETVEMEMEALGGIYLVSCTPVTDETGQLKKIIHIATNITEHKRAEEALQSEKERAQMYFNIAGVVLLVLDADEKVAQINQKGCEILGYGAEDIIGKNWFNHFLPDSCRERLRRGFKDFVSGKIPRKEDVLITGNENPILRQDGRERMILWNSSPIFDPEDKKIIGVLSSGEDITNRKRAEEQLQHYAAELQEANEELSQYAYVVSHDLKAPLRAIHNYADFLREDLEATLDEEQKAYLDGLDRAVQEANALVEDLLQLSRIGQREIEVETLEVGSFLHALFSSLDLPADVEIIMGGDWPRLTTEPVLLRQIFQNLINNAVKFNESAKKRVELGWQQVGEEHYEFFVRDNGIGFDLRHQEKIFRVFERLHTKEEFEGTGIGLAIVKKAVGKLGGSIRVESQPGEGSTFFVMLPKTTTNFTTNWE